MNKLTSHAILIGGGSLAGYVAFKLNKPKNVNVAVFMIGGIAFTYAVAIYCDIKLWNNIGAKKA